MSPDGRNRRAARLRYLMRQLPRLRRRGRFAQIYRIGLLLSAVVVMDLAFPGGHTTTDLPVLEEGMVAGTDVIAREPFPVYKSEAQLAQERADAASAVAPIFDHQPQVADSAMSAARAFFEAIDSAVGTGEGESPRRRAVREVLGRHRIAASESQVALLLQPGPRSELAGAVEAAFGELLRPGVAATSELRAASGGRIVLRKGGEEAVVSRDSVPTMQGFFERAAARAPLGENVQALRLFQNLVISFSAPTIRMNSEATGAARAQARQAVDPVKYRVLEGERIVGAHERVGPDEIERLRGYRAALTDAGGRASWETRLGSGLFSLLLLVILGLFLRYYRPEVYHSARSITLVWFLLLAVTGTAALIAGTESPPELIPIAFAALVLATLFDGLLALVTVFVIVGLVTARPPLLSMSVLFFTLVGGCAAALSGRVVRRRAHTWTLAAVIAGAYLLAALSMTLMLKNSPGWLLESSLWGTLNAAGCAVLAMGVLPIAEAFTEVTTDQTLLELADLNRPLLRRLSLEAPGTYAHSINVANLAEAAARAIDANSLLVRVGVYYHDIGKVKKPQYFVENQPRGWNPHDKLKPAMSASIVREHVSEGLEMAEEAGLPDVVQAFLTEHHGTQKIGFFYERAQELEPDAELDIDEFTYPGPKPHSKETAIVLLADSVESAARTLQEPTPEKITELVDRIVAGKIADGQLDEAPLTFRELSRIKEQFVKVLSSMYHHRLDYPTPEEPAPGKQEPAARGTP